MRITDSMVTSKYIKNLNKIAVDLDKLTTQQVTGRKYMKTSEDVSSAIRGYQLRRNMSRMEVYKGNIDYTQDFLTASETNIAGIQDSIGTATERILAGKNGTQSEDTRKVIAGELRGLQEQIFNALNTNSGGTYIHGGSNTSEKPFTLVDGKLCYNGQNLDTITSDVEFNKLSNDALSIDIGLGIDMDSSGKVNPSSVFQYSISGIKLTGNGTVTLKGREIENENGTIIAEPGEVISNNIYNLVGRIAQEFEKSDGDYSQKKVDELLGVFQKTSEKPYKATTEIGAKTNYLNFMSDRYETQLGNLSDRQVKVEGVDPFKNYTNYATQKAAHDAAILMGSKIILQTVFDYMG